MKNKPMAILFSIILVLQCMLYNMLLPLADNLHEQAQTFNNVYAEMSDTFIKDTVRAEQREVLNAIRQAWVQYVVLNPEKDLLLKEENKYVYRNKEGETLLYDKDTMYIEKEESFYSVYDKATDRKLIDEARPQWNKEIVQEILSIVATPARLFDTNSELIAFDIYTGEVFLDTTKYDKKDVMNVFMIKNDTDRNTGLISLHYEQCDMLLKNANDFSLYKLGYHDRLFIEKVILPYESVGVQGFDMQIGIAIAIRESELMTPYMSLITQYHQTISQMEEMSTKLKVVPKMIIVCSIVIIFLSIVYSKKKELDKLKKKRE